MKTEMGASVFSRTEADTPGDHAIRVVVDGADSQPFWVNIP